jgi:glutamate-1-semialdehyde aminotransferase
MGKKPSIDFNYYKRGNESIAQGCLTNSKHPRCHILGPYPTHLVRGKGCYVFDRYGKQYIDFICGLGTNLLGYANKEITDVCYNEMLKGQNLSFATCTEVEAAEKIKQIFTVDRVKFLKTGTEASMGALKIARAHTGREIVLSAGYHGWSPEFNSLTPPAVGCGSNPYIYPLKDISAISKDIAAVIVEPVELDNSIKRIMWLRELRERCDETGTLLIFDEIITGCRFKNLSVKKCFGVDPDILLLGKAIGGGQALSAICGRADIMDNHQYFVSSTFAGDNVALRACIKNLELLKADNDYKIDDLWGYGDDFINEFNSLWPEKLYIQGYPTRGYFKGDDDVKFAFWQEAVEAGLLFGPSFFISFAHRDVMWKAMEHIKDIVNKLKQKLPILKGDKPWSPFSAKQRA